MKIDESIETEAMTGSFVSQSRANARGDIGSDAGCGEFARDALPNTRLPLDDRAGQSSMLTPDRRPDQAQRRSGIRMTP